MWEGPTKRGEEGGVQSPLAEQFFLGSPKTNLQDQHSAPSPWSSA